MNLLIKSLLKCNFLQKGIFQRKNRLEKVLVRKITLKKKYILRGVSSAKLPLKISFGFEEMTF